jgi:demethylmenaquinone methyltransferase/2-methoxy-6-polyprenyl-1,4-benzoquinol methylase
MPDLPHVPHEPDPEASGLRAFPAARDHAVRELAGMFDDVSGRYDLLNSMMTLGQDRAWRAAMWRAVPQAAGVVLDLCTGSGVSLGGLRRPGRTLLGVDASLRMLELAADEHGPWGWAPRLACADAFRLPFRDGALDAVTIAFGMRRNWPACSPRAARWSYWRPPRPGRARSRRSTGSTRVASFRSWGSSRPTPWRTAT